MYLIKNVLIALDGSETSEKILIFSLDLLENQSVRIVIIGIIKNSLIRPLIAPIEPMTYHRFMGKPTFVKSSWLKMEESLIEILLKNTKTWPCMKIEVKIAEGQKFNVIRKIAKKEKIDHTIMGYTRPRGIKKKFEKP